MSAVPQPTPPQARTTPPHRPWVGFLIVVGSLILILLGFFGYGVAVNYQRFTNGELDLSRYTSSDVTAANVNAPKVDRVARTQIETTDDPTLGPADALVTIVEFGDFECPFCGQAYPIIKDLLRRYGDRVRFIYRDFPNPSLHINALPAALAASCAEEQKKFWPFHDLLFAHQSKLGAEDLRSYGQQAGLNLVAFDQCVSSQRHLQEIYDDYTAGVNAGVQGTPTWFVNGYRLQGAIPPDDFNTLVDMGLSGKL